MRYKIVGATGSITIRWASGGTDEALGMEELKFSFSAQGPRYFYLGRTGGPVIFAIKEDLHTSEATWVEETSGVVVPKRCEEQETRTGGAVIVDVLRQLLTRTILVWTIPSLSLRCLPLGYPELYDGSKYTKWKDTYEEDLFKDRRKVTLALHHFQKFPKPEGLPVAVLATWDAKVTLRRG